VRTGRFGIPRFFFDVGCCCVGSPGGQRHLETLYCGDSLSDALARASGVPVFQGDPGVDLPGEPLPATNLFALADILKFIIVPSNRGI
jgi:hypothetical protein